MLTFICTEINPTVVCFAACSKARNWCLACDTTTISPYAKCTKCDCGHYADASGVCQGQYKCKYGYVLRAVWSLVA